MRLIPLAFLAVLAAPIAAHACSVPVFRYALEQWPPSQYDLYLFHGGRLNRVEEQNWLDLQQRARSCNVRFTRVDVAAELAPEHRSIWETEPTEGILPRVLLRFPDSGPKIRSVWSGTLSEALAAPIFDSPARRELFNRLTFGNAGVVLLLLSGDAEKDGAARRLLQSELPRIARSIELPPRSEVGPQIQSPIPLKVHFPLIEIARTTDESALVGILLGSEDGLEKVRGPIAFPVFGRGRALCSLHGQDLVNPIELRQSLEFLCRACSCQVKELNPGLDLLIRANWEIVLMAETGPMPHEAIPSAEMRPSSSGGPNRAESRPPPPRGYEAVEADDSTSPASRIQWRRVFTLGAIVGFVLTGYWAWQSRRQSPTEPS